jgi:hypothetical protein
MKQKDIQQNVTQENDNLQNHAEHTILVLGIFDNYDNLFENGPFQSNTMKLLYL